MTKSVQKFKRVSRPWSQEELLLLEQLAELRKQQQKAREEDDSIEVISWVEIGRRINGRGSSTCQARYQGLIASRIAKPTPKKKKKVICELELQGVPPSYCHEFEHSWRIAQAITQHSFSILDISSGILIPSEERVVETDSVQGTDPELPIDPQLTAAAPAATGTFQNTGQEDTEPDNHRVQRSEALRSAESTAESLEQRAQEFVGRRLVGKILLRRKKALLSPTLSAISASESRALNSFLDDLWRVTIDTDRGPDMATAAPVAPMTASSDAVARSNAPFQSLRPRKPRQETTSPLFETVTLASTDRSSEAISRPDRPLDLDAGIAELEAREKELSTRLHKGKEKAEAGEKILQRVIRYRTLKRKVDEMEKIANGYEQQFEASRKQVKKAEEEDRICYSRFPL